MKTSGWGWFGALLGTAFLAGALSPVFAQPQNPYCYLADNGPRCDRTPGCYWTEAVDNSACAGRPGMPESQTQFCYVQNTNPAKCNMIPFCRYVVDVTPGQCLSRSAPPLPPGDGAPHNPYCYLSTNERRCAENWGCRWTPPRPPVTFPPCVSKPMSTTAKWKARFRRI